MLESFLETHSDFIRTETLTNVLSSESVLEGEDWDLNGEACESPLKKPPDHHLAESIPR